MPCCAVLPVSVTQNWKNKCDLKKKLLKHFMQITQSWISSQWNLCMSEDLNTDLTHLLATWKIDDKNVMLLETQLSHVEWLLYPRWNCESMKYYTAYFLLLGTINKCLNILQNAGRGISRLPSRERGSLTVSEYAAQWNFKHLFLLN